jgi:hypothetical protein
LETSVGDLDLARADLDEARRLADALGDVVLTADVERHRAFLAIQEGRPGDVLAAAALALAIYRDRSDAWSTGAALLLAAYGSLMVGDAASARRDATEAAGALGELHDSWAMVHAQGILGGVAEAEGRYADAARAFEEAADAAVRMGFVGQAALHRASFARALAHADDPRAAAAYRLAQEEAAEVADGRLGATVRLHRARLARGDGDDDGARSLLEENERWYDSAGAGDLALLNATLLASLRDDDVRLQAVLERSRDEHDAVAEVAALDGLARLAARRGDRDAAVSLLDEADAVVSRVPGFDAGSRVDEHGARSMLADAEGGP